MVKKQNMGANARAIRTFALGMVGLTVLAGCGASGGSSEVEATPPAVGNTNTAPVAAAGSDKAVNIGELVTLDGSASADPDGDTLSFAWQLTSRPSGSAAMLQGAETVTPSFTPDLAGSFTLSLVVSDGALESAADMVTVSVLEGGQGTLDITDAELTRRDGSCAAYVGSYESAVSDVKRNLGFNGSVVIASDGTKCTFTVNEIPNHDFNDAGAQFATDVSEQSGSYQIAVSPVEAANVTEVQVGVSNGVFLNGVSVDIIAAACYGEGNEPLGQEKIGCGPDQNAHPWRYDPMSPLNGFGTDSHNAHPQPNGRYHYHGNPRALFDQQCEQNAAVSPVIGFAADGFPIYGPCIEVDGQIREARASYRLKNNGGARQSVSGYQTPEAGVGSIASSNYDGQFRGDWEYSAGSGDLDECNGMTVNGQYGYYITDSYPWVVGCYKGTVDASFQPSGQALQNLLHSHQEDTHSRLHLQGIPHDY